MRRQSLVFTRVLLVFPRVYRYNPESTWVDTGQRYTMYTGRSFNITSSGAAPPAAAAVRGGMCASYLARLLQHPIPVPGTSPVLSLSSGTPSADNRSRQQVLTSDLGARFSQPF